MTYSKKLPIVTGIIFIFVVIFCLLHPSNYESATVYVTAITASGGVFTGNIISYSRKSTLENVAKIDMSCYSKKAKIELDTLERKLQLQQQYKVTEGDIDQLEYKSDLDELANNTFQQVQNKIDSAKSDASQVNSSDFSVYQ